MSGSARINATRLIDEIIANGATLHFRAAERDLPASFTYDLAGTGDRQRCRNIIATAKADPLLWAAFLEEIAARSQRAA